jgi:hypothetical protein
MPEFQIQITDELVDNILVQRLRESLACLRMDITRITNKDSPTPLDMQDLEDMSRYEPAFVKVLQYYTPHSDWEHI